MEKLSCIFDISYGTKLDKNKTVDKNDKPIIFVSRTSKNHGIDLICNEQVGIIPNDSNTISVPLGGEGRLNANVQFDKYYNGQNVAVLAPKDNTMPLNERIYYSLVIRKNQFKYSAFGREANSTLGDILIPSRNEIPSYVNNYEGYNNHVFSNSNISTTNITKTKLIKIVNLFDVLTGTHISEEEAKKCSDGEIGFVSSGRFNNGIKKKINLVGIETTIFPPRCLSLAKNGSVGTCFYHDYPIVTTTDVVVLKFKGKELNKFEGLFFKVLIEKHIFRFNYGRKINEERLSEMKIRVPIKEDNSIDFDKINDLMKNVQYANII